MKHEPGDLLEPSECCLGMVMVIFAGSYYDHFLFSFSPNPYITGLVYPLARSAGGRYAVLIALEQRK